MFRLPLRPSSLGFVIGFALVALWAFLWLLFFAQLIRVPPRDSGNVPQMTQLARERPQLPA